MKNPMSDTEPLKKYKPMRAVKVWYTNGRVMTTNINGTDKEIKDYYKIGMAVNVGAGENDLITKIKKVKILK